MESVPLVEAAQTPVPDPLGSGSAAYRVPFQGYTAISEAEAEDHQSLLSTNSRRGSLESRNDNHAPSEIIAPDMASSQAKLIIEPFEIEMPTTDSKKIRQAQSRFRDFRELIVKFWLWEAAACIFSLACLASIVGILIYEDGKLLDQWAWSIPPTAVVSFIGTLGKAALVLVLSQLLSQLKWLHFRKTESLRHVRIFDGASRGPLGAVLVLWYSKKLLASIAACLMILTILVDPFVQLVFTFPSKLWEDDSQQAIFLQTNNWTNPANWTATWSYLQPSQWIVARINDGLGPTNISSTAICPSGDCVWPGPIKTLGICGSCSNITADVKVSCLPTVVNGTGIPSKDGTYMTCNYTYDGTPLPQAHQFVEYFGPDSPTTISASRTTWNSTIIAPWEGSITVPVNLSNGTIVKLDGSPITPRPFNPAIHELAIFPNILYNFSAIQLPPIDEETLFSPTKIPAATCWNCETYYCEKTFEAAHITNNNPLNYTVTTKRLWFVSEDGGMGLSPSYGFYPSESSMLNGTVWDFRYILDDTINNYLLELFNSYYMDFSYDKGVWENGDTQQTDLQGSTTAVTGLVQARDLNVTVRQLADSLTEFIRTEPGSSNAVGQNLVSKSFISVRWAWLALPFTLLVITCVLLVVVAITSHSKGTPVWKDDPLALLFHNVNGANILPGGSSKTGTSDLDNFADEIYVKLDRDGHFNFVVSPKKA